jgi:hypothetical protein
LSTSSSSSTIKRKHGKTNTRHGEAKWYLESISSMNTDNTTVPDLTSTPTIDPSTPKLGK